MNANESSRLSCLCLNSESDYFLLFHLHLLSAYSYSGVPFSVSLINAFCWSNAFCLIIPLSSTCDLQSKGGIPVAQLYGLYPCHCSTETWLSETATVIWSEMFWFRGGELHSHNKNETDDDSFHYGKSRVLITPFVKVKFFCLAQKR